VSGRGASIDAHGKPLTDAVLNLTKQSDAVLLGAMGVLVVIACANVTNLLLGRTELLRGRRETARSLFLESLASAGR